VLAVVDHRVVLVERLGRVAPDPEVVVCVELRPEPGERLRLVGGAEDGEGSLLCTRALRRQPRTSRQDTSRSTPSPQYHCFGLGVFKNISVMRGDSWLAKPLYASAPDMVSRSVSTAWHILHSPSRLLSSEEPPSLMGCL
jgi:hypothetical protein